MSRNCKIRAAAESIRWMAELLNGKSGRDRTEALISLRGQLDGLKRERCTNCTNRISCTITFDVADGLLTIEKPLEPPAPIGPLTHRRLEKRRRLGIGPAYAS